MTISDFIKNDIKKMLTERANHMHKNIMTEPIIEEYHEIIDNIDKLDIAEQDSNGKDTHKKRKPSSYNKYIGHCMAKRENNGMALDMATCSVNWKKMSEDDKKGYSD